MCPALTIDEHSELQHGVIERVRQIHTNLARCRQRRVTRTTAENLEVRQLGPRRERGRRGRYVLEGEAGNRSSRQLQHELARTDLRESRHGNNRVANGHRRANAQEPSCAAIEAARVGDRGTEERVLATREWNNYRLRGDDHIEVPAQVILESAKTCAEVIVRVRGEVARLRRQRERAERTGEAR